MNENRSFGSVGDFERAMFPRASGRKNGRRPSRDPQDLAERLARALVAQPSSEDAGPKATQQTARGKASLG